jgi:hypothetical protein
MKIFVSISDRIWVHGKFAFQIQAAGQMTERFVLGSVQITIKYVILFWSAWNLMNFV